MCQAFGRVQKFKIQNLNVGDIFRVCLNVEIQSFISSLKVELGAYCVQGAVKDTRRYE